MKCPQCGNEISPFSSPAHGSHYYAQQLAQYQNVWGQNQLGSYLMQNSWNRYGMSGGLADSIDHSKDEHEPDKPDTKPTAWAQFKDLIKRLIP